MDSIELFKQNNDIFKVLWRYKKHIVHMDPINVKKQVLGKILPNQFFWVKIKKKKYIYI